LNPGDGDITLIPLRNEIAYISQVNDPWFRANISSINILTPLKNQIAYFEPVDGPWLRSNVTTTNGTQAIYYTPNNLFSYLGCVERYQVCLGDSCSPFTGYYNIKNSNFTIPSSTTRPT